MTPAIRTRRLSLVAMTPAFLEVSLTRDRATASRLLGAIVPADWPEHDALLELRLSQLRRDPALEAWLLRAIVVVDSQQMIGHIGFHGAPGGVHLEAYAPGAAEFGYTVFPSARLLGYATEAALGLIGWARTAHRVENFVVSIRPDNAPSLKVAAKLSFQHVGHHIDEEEGLEHVFLLQTGADRTFRSPS